jgi:hypothetical protein
MNERGGKVRSEAAAQKIPSCPIAESYDTLAAEGDSRWDLQHLCSSMTFPNLAEQDDATRLRRLEEWIDKQAKSPRTKELAEPLRAGTGADRAKVLREAAGKLDVFTCEIAKTLESPPVEVSPDAVATVRPYAAPQITGPLELQNLANALAAVSPAMNDCYKKGLATKADLSGRMSVKIRVGTDGKVTDANVPERSFEQPEVIRCVVTAIKGMELPKNPGPLVTALIPLELSREAPPKAP